MPDHWTETRRVHQEALDEYHAMLAAGVNEHWAWHMYETAARGINRLSIPTLVHTTGAALVHKARARCFEGPLA